MLIEQSNISATARSFGVSLRTLRFYEDKGLLQPRRRGAARIYEKADIVRLDLIMTGKRLGFSLAEISDLIQTELASREERDVTDEDTPEKRSIVECVTSDGMQQQLQLLERQRDDIQAAIDDLRAVVDPKLEKG